jgi:hypothetical protein
VNIKQINAKKIILSVVVLAVLTGLVYFSGMTIKNEVNKYQVSWQEIQFAKNHPELVQGIRVKYELGIKALDAMTQDDIKALSPLAQPTATPSK